MPPAPMSPRTSYGPILLSGANVIARSDRQGLTGKRNRRADRNVVPAEWGAEQAQHWGPRRIASGHGPGARPAGTAKRWRRNRASANLHAGQIDCGPALM